MTASHTVTEWPGNLGIIMIYWYHLQLQVVKASHTSDGGDARLCSQSGLSKTFCLPFSA